MLDINKLLVTQKQVRNYQQLNEMILFAKDGGFFTSNALMKYPSRGKFSPLIEITVFEDGQHFIHDGHHRAAAIYLSNRSFIDRTEYRIRNFTYDDYLNPNLKVEWWTPFDPRVEVRLSDMSVYKELINSLIRNQESDETILRYIISNRHMYAEEREDIHTLSDFTGSLKLT